MKLFPTKCHEQATLQKLWRQMGNSSLLPAKCWPLLHGIAGISALFSNFAFVLFCCVTNHLMTGPSGNSEFCFLRISMFPSTSSQETLRFSGNKIQCSPRAQSLSVKYWTRHFLTIWLKVRKKLPVGVINYPLIQVQRLSTWITSKGLSGGLMLICKFPTSRSHCIKLSSKIWQGDDNKSKTG